MLVPNVLLSPRCRLWAHEQGPWGTPALEGTGHKTSEWQSGLNVTQAVNLHIGFPMLL